MRKKIVLFVMMIALIVLGVTSTVLADTPTLPEQVAYDQDGLTITLKSLEMDSSTGEIKVLIENNTADKLIVQVRNFCVNGYVINTSISEEVAPSKKATGTIKFSTKDFGSVYGITEVNSIQLQFIVYVNSFAENFYTDVIHVTLEGNEDYTQEYDKSGFPVYEDDIVEIVSRGLDESGTSIVLFIHNKSGEHIILQARDTSVDGFMIDATMSFEIPAGAYTIDQMKFSPSSLEENDLETVTNVESGFIIYGKGFSVIEKIEEPISIEIE